MNDDRKTIGLQRLRQVLDSYGADTAHWPAEERDELQRFAQTDAAAAALCREAAALDRLLALAAPKDAAGDDMAALDDRILAGFARQREETDDATVVPFPVRRQPSSGAHRARWGAAAALAASFLIGLYVGSSGLANNALEPLYPVATASQGGEQVADVGDLFGGQGIEEDLL